MTKPAVSIQKVTKQFKLEHEKLTTIREFILSNLFFWKRKKKQELIALNDISFEVPNGQTLGIIGDNGSGKSTLLKLILGITPPTSGRIITDGKISALLELGAGFHPDLTGRENIYLNGSVLGIPRGTIDNKIDEIIHFAELDEFIDSPIKHYSSGMYVRLGFSIAVHVDPDILLVDEVLAVGDMIFQQKCIDKVRKFQDAGKTIIIVSHDLGMIEKICDRAILLNHGKIEKDDTAIKTVKIYYDRVIEQRIELAKKYAEVQVIPTIKTGYRTGTGEIKIINFRLLNKEGRESYMYHTGDMMVVEAEYQSDEPVNNPIFGIGIDSEEIHYLNGSNTKIRNMPLGIITGKGIIRITYPNLPLPQGKYLISAGFYRDPPEADETAYDFHACLYSFYVSTTETGDEGLIHFPQDWEIQKMD